MKPVVVAWQPTRVAFVATCGVATAADLVVGWRIGWTAALPAFMVMCAAGTFLGAIDLATSMVPNAVLVPALVLEVLLLGVAAAATGQWWAFERSLLAMAASTAFSLVLALAFSRQFGMGDVMLAACIGPCLGWLGWTALSNGVLLGWLLAAVFVAIRPARRSHNGHRVLAVGPFLVAGAVLAVLLSG